MAGHTKEKSGARVERNIIDKRIGFNWRDEYREIRRKFRPALDDLLFPSSVLDDFPSASFFSNVDAPDGFVHTAHFIRRASNPLRIFVCFGMG